MIWYEIALYGAAGLSIASAVVVSVLALRFYRDNSE